LNETYIGLTRLLAVHSGIVLFAIDRCNAAPLWSKPNVVHVRSLDMMPVEAAH